MRYLLLTALATVLVCGGCGDDPSEVIDGGTDTDTDTDTDTGPGSVDGYVVVQGQTEHSGVSVQIDSTSLTASSDNQGFYEITEVPSATYTLTATLSGFGSATSNPFQVIAGETTTVPPLTLMEGVGILTGTVLLEGETEHGGTAVMVEGTSHATVTSSTGSWSIDGVVEGNYAVRAARDGFDDETVSDRDVLAGQVTDVPTMTLLVSLSSISGDVTLENTTDFGGVSVTATASWNPSITYPGSTNTAGHYQITGVQPGLYTVEATKTNYETGVDETVSVMADTETTGVDFYLLEVPIGVATQINYMSGGSSGLDPMQMGTVYNGITDPLVVEVLDALGDPVQGWIVFFQVIDAHQEGYLVHDQFQTTDVNGLASNEYVLGKMAGVNNIRATATALAGDWVDFYAEGTPDAPTTIVSVAGSLQSGTVGQVLPVDIEVEARDQWTNPVPGQAITFTPSGDGVAGTPSTTTDVDGQATTIWTLGTTAALDPVYQSMTVVCGGATTDIHAFANHDTAYQINKISGDAQSGINTTTLPIPLLLEVVDQYGNPVDGETVTFTVTTGTGTLNPDTPQVSNSNGQSFTILTVQSLGTVEVTADVSGLTSVVFSASSLTGPPDHFTIVSGDGQQDVVTNTLAAPIVVRMEDGFNNPIADAWVNFAAGATSGTPGNVGTGDVQTNASGEAQTTFTLGELAGDDAQWVTAHATGFSIPDLIVYADSDPDVPDAISIVSGDAQSQTYGRTLPDPLVVYVNDQYGNPAWDYDVDWTSSTGGTFSVNPTTTDSSGNASATAMMGTTLGVPAQHFTATANGHSVIFDATATGHWIKRMEPSAAWPGYPDPLDAASGAGTNITMKIIGGGFDTTNAVVAWEYGTVDEELFTPTSITDTEITYEMSADHFWFGMENTYEIVVLNPGPSASAPEDFIVGHLIPDTGQTDTQCTDWAVWQWIWEDCANILPGDDYYGQDGHYQPPTRQHHYTDNADGTVTDDVTGLMWMQCSLGQTWSAGPSCGSTIDAVKIVWSIAVAACDVLDVHGYDDWRLPSIEELSTTVDASEDHPPIDETVFPTTPIQQYWSSSPYAADSNYAWHVTLDTGVVAYQTVNNTNSVRCVRAGPLDSGPLDPLVLSSNRVIEDGSNGLMWQGCAAGQGGTDCSSGTASVMEWDNALDYCESLHWAGFNDWRLPSRNDSQNIVDYDFDDPAIDETVFPGTPSNCFWSSSSCLRDSDWAWCVDFSDGFVIGDDIKHDDHHARCVRDGS